jgi:hypothetical protein
MVRAFAGFGVIADPVFCRLAGNADQLNRSNISG